MAHGRLATQAIALATLFWAAPGIAGRTRVEVWVHGSDIETPEQSATLALRDSVENAIRRSSDFSLAAANSGMIKIFIPEQVLIAYKGQSKYILYNIEISSNKMSLTLTGYCEGLNIDYCSRSILQLARLYNKQPLLRGR